MACAETHNMSYQSPIPLAGAAASCRRLACRYLCSLSIMWNTATISLRIRRSYSTHKCTHRSWHTHTYTHTGITCRHGQGHAKDSYMMSYRDVPSNVYPTKSRSNTHWWQHKFTPGPTFPHVMFLAIKTNIFLCSRIKNNNKKRVISISAWIKWVFLSTVYFLDPPPQRIKQLPKQRCSQSWTWPALCSAGPRITVCQSKSPPRSDKNKTVRSRGSTSTFLCMCVKCLRMSMCCRIISDSTWGKKKEEKGKHNNLKEIPTLQLANLRAVSQCEWQPLLPRETAINWVSW